MDEKHERLRRARELAGFQTPKEAAEFLRIAYPTYWMHENGTRGFGSSEEKYARVFNVSLQWLAYGIGDTNSKDDMPLLGYVGAGNIVSTDGVDDTHEVTQRPSDMPKGSFGLKVRGDSMRPYIAEGDTILCFPQKSDAKALINTLCVVKTDDNMILVKYLKRGYEPETYNLESSNAETIENARIIWASKVHGILKK